jgi:hypothetical protein
VGTDYSGVYGIAISGIDSYGGRAREHYGRDGLMPGKKHVRGVSAKEQREYEHIKESAERSGRYGERAKEVAARTVLKKHKAEGHSKGH